MKLTHGIYRERKRCVAPRGDAIRRPCSKRGGAEQINDEVMFGCALAVCAGLKKLLEHDEEATGGSVQDVFCLSFEVPIHLYI